VVEIIDIFEEHVPIFKPEGGLPWQGILMVFVCCFHFNTKTSYFESPKYSQFLACLGMV